MKRVHYLLTGLLFLKLSIKQSWFDRYFRKESKMECFLAINKIMLTRTTTFKAQMSANKSHHIFFSYKRTHATQFLLFEVNKTWNKITNNSCSQIVEPLWWTFGTYSSDCFITLNTSFKSCFTVREYKCHLCSYMSL